MASSEAILPPPRPIQDYLMGSARYGLPDYVNKEKWNNRVVNNLLYYQTNYAITALIVFCIVGYARPHEMVAGIVIVVGSFVGLFYAASNPENVKRFKAENPAVTILGLITVCTMLMYAQGSILVFGLGIALPIFCVLLHASLRMRNLKNKVLNAAEVVGLKSTPMGRLLKALGQDT